MRQSLLALCLIAIALPSHADCRFKTGRAVVCRFSPQNAADAYRMFGFDIERADLSYNKEILRRADCAQLSNRLIEKHPLREVRSFNVATPVGWVEIVQFAVEDRVSEVFVARDYLSGKCVQDHSIQVPR